MSRCATCGLNKRSLAAQKSLLVRVQNADERNFGKIEAFPQQVDPDQNIEISRTQAAQNLDALYRVDVAMEIAHFQSDIAQIIGEIFGRAFRQRCHQNALALLDPLPAKQTELVRPDQSVAVCAARNLYLRRCYFEFQILPVSRSRK